MKQKNRWLYIAYMLVAACMVLLPVCLIPLQGEAVSREKRDLAEMPKLWQENGLNLQFSTEYEAYLADHLAGRSLFTTGYHWLIGEVLRSSPTDRVIVGRDDWLFYGETMADYQGTNRWSEEELQTAMQTLTQVQSFVEQQGGRFLFVIAPNKNSLYPEYMPYYELASGEPSNAERLIQAMEEQGIGTVDLFGAFREDYARTGEALYHKRDSHWNREGAHLAYQTIMRVLGREEEAEAYAETDRTEVWNWEGDLDALIYPELGYLDRQVEYEIDYSYEYLSRFRSPEDMEIRTDRTGKTGSLYMIRDSFGNVLYPFLAEQFGSAVFSRETPWQLPQVSEGDVVIIELVERNLDLLLTQEIEYAELPEKGAENSPEASAWNPVSEDRTEPSGGSEQESIEAEEAENTENGEADDPDSGAGTAGEPETPDGGTEGDSGGQNNQSEQMGPELTERCRKILSGILIGGMDERERAYAIYKWVESNIRYSGNTPTDSWTESALLTLDTGRGNCYGYYSVSRALLTEAGYVSTEVKFPDNGHYWNRVRMSDGWYHFDTTTGWGGERFLLTDEELAAYRYGDLSYEWNPVELPEETQTEETSKEESPEDESPADDSAEESPVKLDAASIRLPGGTVLSLNQNMAEVTKLLGEPIDYMESKSCMYDGMDKTWIYSDVTVKTYPGGGRDYVNSLEITSDTIETASGIRVGASLQTVFEIYGMADAGAGGYYEYSFDGYGIVFYMDEAEKVEAIEWYLK